MYENLEQYFKRALSRYVNLPDWEDAVQEAVIQYWKDTEAGVDNPDKCKARAVLRAKGILFNQTGAQNGVCMTGHVGRKSTQGTRKPAGDASRDKIISYTKEFKSLHNREPGVMELSRGLGIGREAVSQHLRKIRSYGGLSVPISEIKLERIAASDDLEAPLAVQLTAFEWESTVVDQLSVRQLMSVLTEREKEVVFMFYWEDKSPSIIAKAMDTTPVSVNRWLRAAEAKLREAHESG